MDLSGSFSVGPFVVPFFLIFAAGVLAAALLIARIPLRHHRVLRSRVTERLSNAVVIFAVGWKLTPAALHPRVLFVDPLSLLAANSGIAGLGVGVVVAAAYLALSLLRRESLRRAAVLPLVLFAGVTAVGMVGARVASTLAVSSNRAAGPPPQSLILPALDGGSVSLEALKGRVVVVNFWATWCPPCRAELPDLAAFARIQGVSGARIVGVNATYTETAEQAVRTFAMAHGIDFPVALDRTGDITRAWGVRAWPTTVIVGPDGRIAGRRTGAVDAAWLRREVRLASQTATTRTSRITP